MDGDAGRELSHPGVGCTDSHYTNDDNPHRPARVRYTLAFTHDREEPSPLEAIRSGRSVAVNAVGDPERVQNSYRYEKLPSSCWTNFFSVYRQLCHDQGVVMAERPTDSSPAPETE